MCRIFFYVVVFIQLICVLPARAATKLIAVLPLDVRHTKGKLDADAQASLEEMLRDVTANALRPNGWTVLSGENTLQVLKDNGVDAENCGQESCHLSMAREIKTEAFISGAVQYVDGTFTASIRLIDTRTGSILTSSLVTGKTVMALREAFEEKAPKFFARGGLVAGGSSAATRQGTQSEPPPPVVETSGPQVKKGSVTESVGQLTVTAKPKDKVRLELTDPDGIMHAYGVPFENARARPGHWRATAKALGYEEETREFDVPADDVTLIKFDLKLLGGLSVTGGPSGADVVVDGPGGFHDEGGLPWQATGLRRGTYDVKVSRDGYVTVTQVAEVEPGETASLTVSLQRKPAIDETLQEPSDPDAGTGNKRQLATASNGDHAPAPIKLSPFRTLTRDDNADRTRDMEITRIKKTLPKMTDANVKADLMFQLAQAWWEKSRYIHDVKEMPPWQEAADKWSACVNKKGRRACGPELRPNTTLSEQYRSSAVDLYSQLVKNYKNYPRLDEVWFILGNNKMDLASRPDNTKAKKDQYQKEALAAYRTIITNYPKSKFVCDTNVELGNYFFDNNQLNPARHAYEDGLRCEKTKTYATYRLAWCDYNAEDYTSAIKRFKDVVAAANRTTEKNDVDLRSAALRDLVLSFQKARELDTAISFYTKALGKGLSLSYIEKVANAYFEAGGYDYAIRVYRSYLIRNYPLDPSAPVWQSKIVIAYEKQGQRDLARKEAETLENNYGADSVWLKAQQDPHAREMESNLVREMLALTHGRTTEPGGLTADEIGRTVRSHWNEIRDCYEKALNEEPNLAGNVALYWEIGPEGTVTVASVKESDLNNRDAETCMVASVRRWKFPTPRGGGVVNVNYPFIFQPQ